MAESMQKLAIEQERTDKLLYQLLPRSVADKLRTGISPMETCETFECVTVLFTDVVGFTTICSGIPPLAVVETIGDAYMVVGGAPDRTIYHSEQVADCARSLVSSVVNFVEEVSHKPVRIRAGCHSGAVIGGVVGLKMPRYCLFGETVLIGNSMESTGKPMQIQISETTKDELDRVATGLFETTPNTKFSLKGAKTYKTFWLTGKNGPPRKLLADDGDSCSEASG